MSIKGGIVSNDDAVEMTISISGGKAYKRVYNDVVSLAVDKLTLIGSFLSQLLSSDARADTKFYIEQTKQLLRRGHIELISGNLPFHNKYNMWLLDGYVRMLLETCDLKMIAQLLDLDSILYSIEHADEKYDPIEFEISSKIKPIPLDSADKIRTPISDDIGAYLHSFDHNMGLLVKLVTMNKGPINEVYNCILAEAKKRLA